MTSTTFWIGLALSAALAAALTYLHQRRRLRRAIAAAADADALTALPARKAVRRDWSVLLGPAGGYVLLLDLDGFRRVNAERGAEAGDAALQHVVDRVQRTLRPGQRLGRWSSDGFIVFLPAASLDEAASLAERLRIVIEQTAWEWEEREVVLTATIAIAIAAAAASPDDVIRDLEQAMLDGKQRGRNRVSPGAGVRLPTARTPTGAPTPTPRSTVTRSVVREV